MKLNYDDILIEYTRLRSVSRALNSKIVRKLDREDTAEAARRLGLSVKGGILAFDSQDEVDIMMDHAVHGVFREGKNVVDRCLEDTDGQFTDEEIDFLEAMTRTRYGVFIVAAPEDGVGFHAVDIVRSRKVFIADVFASQTLEFGMVMAGRTIPFPDFDMTTGCLLPVLPESAAALDKVMPSEPLQLLREEEEMLAARITRALLQTGSASQIVYGTPDEDIAERIAAKTALWPEDEDDSRAANMAKTGRNDPCPCGSGKKYKKCCLRHNRA